jgi:hypothetical protein
MSEGGVLACLLRVAALCIAESTAFVSFLEDELQSGSCVYAEMHMLRSITWTCSGLGLSEASRNT